MTNNNKGLLKGLLLGAAAIGGGLYVYKNKDLRNQIGTKVKTGVDSLNSGTSDLKIKANEFIKTTKESLDHTIKDTKISLDDTIVKTSDQVNTLSKRISNAISAGKEAAQDSIKSQDKLHEAIAHVKESAIEKLDFIKDKVQVKKDLSKEHIENHVTSLGATENNSPQNTNELHPATANVSRSIGDAGTNFDSLNKK